ncbi:MAG: ATP-binding protein [Deltaproteobacteria bacterium]
MVDRLAAWFSRKGLQVQFIALTMCAIVVVMGVLGTLAVHRERGLLYEEVEKQGRLLGETLAIPIINDLIYEKLGLVEEGGLLDNYILEIFSRQDLDLLYMAILDERGKVISHNDISEYGKTYADPLTRKALDGERTIVQRSPRGEHDALDVGVPLSIGKKRWGTLKLGISLEKADHRILATVWRIVLLTALLMAAGFLIVLLLSRRFIGPVTQLANTMENAPGDTLDIRVPVRGQDELALLADRFNRMIDRIRQANEELRKTHEKLAQSEKLASLGVLAAGVAHEINNPLGGIFNCLRMLERGGEDPAQREKYLGLAKEGMERIEATVSKLLWMARKPEHRPVEFGIREEVEKTRSLLDYRFGKRGISFVNGVDGDLRLTMDPHDFQQVLLNLCINAVDAMSPDGVLTVAGARADGSVVVEVADTGGGIAPENLGKIFDPFFSTKPPGEGTGLGLWLTYEIVRNYDGEIRVDSRPGEGTRFFLRFPAKGTP